VNRPDVVLGPLATIGGALLGLGLVRRSWKLVVTGAVAVAVDQRLPAARRLNDRLLKNATQA
jgi:hypothetical protein